MYDECSVCLSAFGAWLKRYPSIVLSLVFAEIVRGAIYPRWRRPFDMATRREWAAAALAVVRAKNSVFMMAHDATIRTPEPGRLDLTLKVDASRQNFLASMHGGAIASAIDVATTLAIFQEGRFPGASASLSVTYLAGCPPGAEVVCEARVIKLGRNVAFTEAVVRRVADGVAMARGSHTKYVTAPYSFDICLGRPIKLVATTVLRNVLLLGLSDAVAKRDFAPGDDAPHDAATERDTGLPRDEAGKRQYFATYGEPGKPFQGWDRPFSDGALTLVAPYKSDAEAVEWDFVVGKPHLNTFGALHGGCAASLVDVLGSAVVAMGDRKECGVAVMMEVQFCTPAKRGQVLRWTAKVARRGGRLVTVAVEATCEKGRTIVAGSVTKSLRGLSKQKAR